MSPVDSNAGRLSQTARGRPPAGPRGRLLGLFREALAAVDGRAAVRAALAAAPVRGPVTLIALGKAAEAMALGAIDALGEGLRDGLVVSKAGHLDPVRLARLGLEAMEGGHPVPTAGSLAAGRRLLDVIDAAPPGQDILFLISGGASSLVEVPMAGLDEAGLARANAWLLGSGLPIDAVNRVRKALSRVKGGGLLGRLGDRAVRALAISDVPGDDPAVIGSGLLVPEGDLGARLAALALPGWLRALVDRGLEERGALPPGGPRVELVATLDAARRAAAEAGTRLGLAVHLHSGFIAGDAAERGRDLAAALLAGPPGLSVWGGETTVRLPSDPGRGGRNQHLALAAATVLAGHGDCFLLSAGSDGSDGPTEDAGALVDGGTLARAAVEGLDAAECLARADAGRLLAAAGDLIHTGPTGTNVMDLILGLKL
jgi:hydroxypyruvate reductase